MNRDDAEAALAAAGETSDPAFPLFEAAIACALHEDASRDPEPARACARDAAERVAARLKQDGPAEALADAMALDMRLGGDLMTYEDPANADIISLWERRRGLPVTLGVAYITAGRAAGLDVRGVDFPNHFLLRIETPEGPLALDPFADGRVVPPSELARRALHAGQPPEAVQRLDVLMAPIPDRLVLIRVQNNLYLRAREAGDHAAAERAALRRALLLPSDHRTWLDLAAEREAQGALSGALEALARAKRLEGGGVAAARAAHDRVRLRLN
ncbi:MAG TPA: transglutaminase family protein [Caulobacteraceae bacterium]|nr:transglutaminase family protein [Caulobacteraceae bacterium]